MSDTNKAQDRRTLPSLLWGIMVRPRSTMEYLSRNGARLWWIPALLTILLMVVPMILSAQAETRQAQQAVLVSPKEAPSAYGVVTEMSVESQPPSGPNAAGIALRVLGRVVGVGFTWLLWAVGLYLASVFLGRSSTFGQMFRLTVWAWIPYAVRGLLQTLYILIARQPIVNAGLSGFVIDKNSAAMSLIPPSPGQVAYAAVLSQVDLFLIWNLFLLITGLIAVTRLTRIKSIVATLIIWLVFVLLSLIPALVGSMFSTGGGIF